MLKKIKLYRGDRINSDTEAGRYRFDGIISKSFGKGSPAYIAPLPLLENIRSHINPVTPSDHLIYSQTEFISFSSSFDRAYFWLSDQGSQMLFPCLTEYEETRYMFTLEIPEEELEALDKDSTMFLFRFACNPDLKRSNSSSIIENLMLEVVAPNTWFRHCDVCRQVHRAHSLVLVDAVKYLQVYGGSDRFDGAAINAAADKEWLILATDPVNGLSATSIPRSDFWSVSHYSCKGELRPPGMHEIAGLGFDLNGDLI